VNPFARGPETISPTAHYTGYVWARNGLAPEGFATREGALIYHGSRPLATLSGVLGGPTVESFLLARHRILDALLEEAVTEGTVSQVVEVAAGMSPRGARFAERHGDALTYVEADLPGMAARKRDALARAGLGGPSHRVAEIDALRDAGPASLASIASDLDPSRGTAIITEGLLNYLSPADVASLWPRFAATLRGFPHGLYLSDLHVGEQNSGLLLSLAKRGLGTLVRGSIHFHHATSEEARARLLDAGFDEATLHAPAEFADHIPGTGDRGAQLVRIVEARTVS
jgi:O-methyltransferase involved in polyketide biosynthesis